MIPRPGAKQRGADSQGEEPEQARTGLGTPDDLEVCDLARKESSDVCIIKGGTIWDGEGPTNRLRMARAGTRGEGRTGPPLAP